MKKQLLTLILLIACFCSQAQITFQKTFGGTGTDGGYSVQQTTDGGYIITGYTRSFGTGNIYLIKADANGDTLWTKTFGGTGVIGDIGNSIQQTTDSGYIIVAYTWSFGAGNSDVYLIKTDVNGNTLWSKTFGSFGYDRGYSVQQTLDGGYIVTGFTEDFGAGSNDVYLIKTDLNGDSLWTKTFGGTSVDEGYSVQQTTDGGYIIAGRTWSFGLGVYDVYLIKTNAIGDTLWTKTLGGTAYDNAGSIQQTGDGGYIIAGTTASFGAGNGDVYLIKTDTNGTVLWTKTFGGIDDDGANFVQQTSDSGYIIAGFTNSFGTGSADVYLIRTDPNGDTLWTKTFGGTGQDGVSSIRQTTDKGFIIAGWTYSFGAGMDDIYLIKTDSLGNSGCNQGSTSTIVITPFTQVTSPLTMVSSGGLVTTPATIVGSGGIVNALCTTSINEITPDISFFISQNPSAGNFIISFEGTIMKGSVEILNILGESVYTENISNEAKKEISLKNSALGIYFVKVFYGEKYYCKKIIIE